MVFVFVIVVDDSLRFRTTLKLLHHRTFMYPRIKISTAGFPLGEKMLGHPPTPRNSNLDWALTFCYLEKHSGIALELYIQIFCDGYCLVPTS